MSKPAGSCKAWLYIYTSNWTRGIRNCGLWQIDKCLWLFWWDILLRCSHNWEKVVKRLNVWRTIMTRKYGLAGQRSKRKTERSRSAGIHSAAVEEGKFHVSVWVSQRAQIFGGVANVSPNEPEQHQSPCFFIMGQGKLRLEVRVTCCFHWSAVKQISLLI